MKRRFGRRGTAAIYSSRTYYVDATSGDDANAGTEIQSPWKTIAKVNAFTGFGPGDTILFKRGETWTGTQLTVPANNLTFADYGSGDKPIIDANSAVDYGIYATGKTELTLRNLDIRNGSSSCAGFTTCSGVNVYSCDMSGAGNDNLLFYNGCTNCAVYGGTYFNSVAGAGHCGIEISDGGSGFVIDSVDCYNNNEGISVNNHADTAMPTNVVISNSTTRSNLRNGIQISENMAHGDLSITIDGCTVHTNANDNIQIAPIGSNYPSGIIISDCISYGATRNTYYISGDGILMKNCISYDNGVAACKGVKVINAVGVTMYNNSLYFTSASYPAIVVDGTRTNNFTFKNNIQGHGAGTEITLIDITAALVAVSPTLAINYNVWHGTPTSGRWKYNGSWVNWANWKANSGQDANSPTPADPLYTNPVSDFTLQAGSPAINAGVDVGLPYSGAAPDCGAYEKA